MRNINWAEVTTPNTMLPAGGYAIEIQDVVDHEDWESLDIIYNVIDGQFKDIYKNLPQDDDWKHKFSQKYSDKAVGFFKRFLQEIEADNPGFDMNTWGNDPLKLVGKKMGVLLGEYRYVYDGKAKSRLQAVRPLTLAQVKAGDFEVPDPSYARGLSEEEWNEMRGITDKPSTGSDASVYDDDIPFL